MLPEGVLSIAIRADFWQPQKKTKEKRNWSNIEISVLSSTVWTYTCRYQKSCIQPCHGHFTVIIKRPKMCRNSSSCSFSNFSSSHFFYFTRFLRNYRRYSDLIFSRPRSEGWPHHGRTFSIYPRSLSFWLSLPWRVLSTSWCCPSRPCVAFLAFVHLALFLALSLSPSNSLVSSWCDHRMLASLLWRCLTVPSVLQLC